MSRPATILSTLLVVMMFPNWVYSQTLSPKDLDARIENQLFEVLRLGTDIYNRGSHDACYRLYQGSLLITAGFLDHRPDQKARIEKAFRESDALLNVKDRAFALRDAIDDLRTAIKATHTVKAAPTNPATASTPSPAKVTLWERLGGELSMTLIAEDLVNRVLANPRINFTRRGTGYEWDANPEKVNLLKKQFLHMLSSVTGGPLKYTGKNMKEAHLRMKISDPEFDALMIDLTATLDKFFVSPAEKADLIRIISSTKKEIVDASTVMKSLWERLGGEPTVLLLVDDVVKRAAINPLVNFSRKGTGKEWPGKPDDMARLKKHLVQYISSVSNGPDKYDAKLIKDIHEGMKINEAEFNALVADFKASMDVLKVNVREQEELLKIIEQTRKDIVVK